MSAESLLYPRLPRPTAKRLMAEQYDWDLLALREAGALTHPEAEPAATGGRPADAGKLAEVQRMIRAVADDAGFPRPLSNSQDFDRPCGTGLLATMDIVPADAANEGVWSFLTLVVVPEIGPWRFPSREERRLLGHPRNTLRRTWWRAWAIGPDLTEAPEGCTPMGEDESVQIMERPSLGGNRRTAQALVHALWRAESKGMKSPRSEVMRQLTRRARAKKSHLLFDALDDPQLAELMDQTVQESLMAMGERLDATSGGADRITVERC